MTDPAGHTTYGYDTAGRLSSVAGPGANASYSYDAAGNRATMTAAGKTASYTYDPDNRLATVSRPDLGTFGFAYNADGGSSAIGGGSAYRRPAVGISAIARCTYRGPSIIGFNPFPDPATAPRKSQGLAGRNFRKPLK